jgi:alpha-1,6-mannosyltransferase
MRVASFIIQTAPLMKSLSVALALTGAAYLAAAILLALTQASLGSALFFTCAATMAAAYVVMLWRVSRERTSRRQLIAAFVVALAFRVPLVFPRVAPESDMVRYLWDGRIQTLGYSPYAVTPDDPAVAWTHTDETRAMPSHRARSPYPPAAQLFFRLVVTIHDSTRAMKTALTFCDVLTIIVLWRWLIVTGRSEWLALAYAWNPLVILEIAHSGHIDALGALWIVASAYWLARRRTALATIAFGLAVATKLLPIVLAPLYVGRIRMRDALGAGALLAALYLTFSRGGTIEVGTIPSVIQNVRFNSELFRFVMRLVGNPQRAAAVAVSAGLVTAMWARWRLDAGNPAAWAWPMAIALAFGPVIYPWYLLYFTPFLLTTATIPLAAWTLTVIPIYIVWELAFKHGARWAVPPSVMMLEYAIPLALAAAIFFWRLRTQQNGTRQHPVEPGRTP